MNIVLASDEKYVLPMSVTLYSAIKNLSKKNKIHVYIIDGGITDESRGRIEHVVSPTPPTVELHWVSVDTNSLAGLPTHEWINTSMYLRLYIPKVLPTAQNKVIYLDSDLLVKASLARLWHKNLGNRALAAVQSYGTPYVSSPRGLTRYRELGYAPDTPYFNSGILLLNLERWRQDSISARVLDYVREYREAVEMPDQDALNAILADDWKHLDLKWNVMSHLINFDDWPESPFKERVRSRRRELLHDPFIYHFAGGSKPWQIACNHPSQLQWIGDLWESGWFSPAERLRWFGEWFLRYYWFQVKRHLGII